MEGIEYIFGLGDGEVETWVTPAGLDLDGDGVLDAVALDFDGDGLFDDALWDCDGDGAADRAVLDVGPGRSGPEGRLHDGSEWYADPGGDGTWSEYRIGGLDLPADPEPVAPQAASPVVVADPKPTIVVDTDGDGLLDTGLTDSDGDGLLDTVSAAGASPYADGWWGWAARPR